jgi:hypothetical protein
MKAKLEFSEEEYDDLMITLHAPEAFSALWDIQQKVREYFKHTEPSEENAERCLEDVADIIFNSNIMDHYK